MISEGMKSNSTLTSLHLGGEEEKHEEGSNMDERGQNCTGNIIGWETEKELGII